VTVQSLFDKTADFNDDVFRNITSLRESEDLFDDLSDGHEFLSNVARTVEMKVKSTIPPGIISRGFHYTTAIDYPFMAEPYLITRYGNGAFGVWYASLDLETTIHETAYHMLIEELRVEGTRSPVYRERAVYLVQCRAILIDLRGKEKDYPDLVSNDYSFTHQVGERLYNEGHPGFLAPSARYNGTNLIAFAPSILSNPKLNCYLTYICDPQKRTIIVERQPGEIFMQVRIEL